MRDNIAQHNADVDGVDVPKCERVDNPDILSVQLADFNCVLVRELLRIEHSFKHGIKFGLDNPLAEWLVHTEHDGLVDAIEQRVEHADHVGVLDHVGFTKFDGIIES